MSELAGKVAVITGANQGLGKAVADAFWDEGATLAICARDAEKLQAVQEQLQSRAASGQRVIAQVADVSKPHDVQAFCRAVLEALGKVDVLVNNAGVYGPKGTLEEVDFCQWAKAVEINLFGTVLMCQALLPHFHQRRRGKIINLSGGGATAPLPRLSAYAASKAAVVRLTETLAEENKNTGVEINAIAPGALNTRLLDEVIESGAEKVGKDFYAKALKQKESGGTPLDIGARLAVFLASDSSDGISGKLISAVWDPWQKLPEHISELAQSDIYTLRRIVPSDRGKDWGNP